MLCHPRTEAVIVVTALQEWAATGLGIDRCDLLALVDSEPGPSSTAVAEEWARSLLCCAQRLWVSSADARFHDLPTKYVASDLVSGCADDRSPGGTLEELEDVLRASLSPKRAAA
jgi:hypothetical protein